jgi:DNA-binding CsgD family transcriptional regulator
MRQVPVATRDVFRLTPREEQIVSAVRRGDTTRQIAAAHGLGRQTVKNYLTTIYEKLGVTGRVELQQSGGSDSVPQLL